MATAALNPREEYESRKAARAAEEARLLGRTKSIATARALVFAAALAVIGAIAISKVDASFWWLALLLLGVFAALVFMHANAHRQLERASLATLFYERGLQRLSGKWSSFSSTGERFMSDTHPFADDLDVLGKASLFQLIDNTQTKAGEARLAALLLTRETDFPRATRARQDAVRELASRLDLREEMAVLGGVLGSEKADPAAAISWASKGEPLGASGLVILLARLAPVAALALFLLGRREMIHTWAWTAPVILGMVLTALHPRAQAALSLVGHAQRSFAGFTHLIELCERAGFASDALVALETRLRQSGAQASREMKRLERIVGFIDARQNEVFRLFIAPLFWWDLNCAIALEAWRTRVAPSVAGWFDAMYEMEALASLASFTFENPSCVFPKLSDEPVFEARGLGHPLIGAESRVANDVARIARGTGFVVTGSNMSGKSTFLRTLGLNAVLANAGAPVVATEMCIGSLDIVTSMRVRDSLDEGVSRFYAELRRLKAVVESARKPPKGSASFFLLDEILHGTNTRERVIGASAILRELIACGAMGAVSTHDLALGELEKETGGALHNVHFEEQVVGEKMTFDYRLRQGVVTSSNALRLMKIVGIDVIE